MAKTKIDWCDFSINPVKGLCPMACEYCYARRMYKRFHWDETIRYDDMVWQTGSPIYNGSKVFVGSTMELFGEWVKPDWLNYIFDYVRSLPNLTFIFLTKQPRNLLKWSPFPDNCWVGSSVTNAIQQSNAYVGLGRIRASVKFISYEPLLNNVFMEPQFLEDAGINWIIIGQQTPVRPSTQPKVEWIREIVEAADITGVPVFFKDNLVGKCDRNGYPVDGVLERHNTPWAYKDKGASGICLRREFPREAK